MILPDVQTTVPSKNVPQTDLETDQKAIFQLDFKNVANQEDESLMKKCLNENSKYLNDIFLNIKVDMIEWLSIFNVLLAEEFTLSLKRPYSQISSNQSVGLDDYSLQNKKTKNVNVRFSFLKAFWLI